MSDQFALECECGRKLVVDACQAGESRRCACGQIVAIPTLRQLRQLPTIDSIAPSIHSKRQWSQTQGITFVAGAVIATAAVVALAYLIPQRLRLPQWTSSYDRFLAEEDLSELSSADLWDAWAAYRDYGLQWGHSAAYTALRERAFQLNCALAIAAVALLSGTAVIIASLCLGRRRIQPG